MSEMIEEIVRLKNKAWENQKDSYLMKKSYEMFKDTRFGFQILDENKEVLEEFTLFWEDKKITYIDGLDDPNITFGMKKDYTETLLDKMNSIDEDKFFKHPIWNSAKWLPGYVLHAFKGDLVIGKRKE